jgi:oligoribonuclease
MSHINPHEGKLLEIYIQVTNNQLITLDSRHIVLQCDDQVLDSMHPWCKVNHNLSSNVDGVYVNSLMDDVNSSTTTLAQAEKIIVDLIDKYSSRPVMLAGCTVQHDRLYLVHHMPSLASKIHYRVMDMSSVKEMVFRCGNVKAPRFRSTHRAKQDVEASIELARYYQQLLFGGMQQQHQQHQQQQQDTTFGNWGQYGDVHDQQPQSTSWAQQCINGLYHSPPSQQQQQRSSPHQSSPPLQQQQTHQSPPQVYVEAPMIRMSPLKFKTPPAQKSSSPPTSPQQTPPKFNGRGWNNKKKGVRPWGKSFFQSPSPPSDKCSIGTWRSKVLTPRESATIETKG